MEKSQAERFISVVQWVCVAVVAVLLVMHLMGKAPSQRILIVEILAGIYVVLFAVGKWLELQRRKGLENSASSP